MVYLAVAAMSREQRGLAEYGDEDIRGMLTFAAIGGSMATRFLDEIWATVLDVAYQLRSRAGEVLDVSAIADVIAVREAYRNATAPKAD